jgi:hypothetical protein
MFVFVIWYAVTMNTNRWVAEVKYKLSHTFCVWVEKSLQKLFRFQLHKFSHSMYFCGRCSLQFKNNCIVPAKCWGKKPVTIEWEKYNCYVCKISIFWLTENLNNFQWKQPIEVQIKSIKWVCLWLCKIDWCVQILFAVSSISRYWKLIVISFMQILDAPEERKIHPSRIVMLSTREKSSINQVRLIQIPPM